MVGIADLGARIFLNRKIDKAFSRPYFWPIIWPISEISALRCLVSSKGKTIESCNSAAV